MTKRRHPTTVTARRQAARDEREALKNARPRKARGASPVGAADSFQNFGLALGMGTANALSSSQYGFNPITRVRTLLEWIYRGTWIGGAAVNLRAEDMTRAGIEVNTTMPPGDVETLQAELSRLGVWRGIQNTKKWASLYGGALGVMLMEGQDLAEPLRIDATGRGQFRGIAVLDRWMVDPTISSGGLVEELGPDLGKPKFYLVRSDSSMLPGNKIHYSRCLRLLGDEMPYWQSVMENLWGTSVYERIYDRLVAFDSATQGAAQSVYKSAIRTYKVDKLRELVTTGGKAYQGLLRYVDMMRMFQGVEGITLLDGKDEFVVNQANVQSGMSEALIQFGQQLCGALRIPAVRLFGMSPAGLNSTGESDWRNYYDGINTEQESDLRMFVDRVTRVTARSEGLDLPDNFGFNFTPLWQMTAPQKAEVADRKTDTVIKSKESGLYGRSTALKELRQQSRETGVHTNVTDDDIKAAKEEDDLEPPGIEATRLSLPGGSPAAGRPVPGAEGGTAVPLPTPRGTAGPRDAGFIDNRFDVRSGAVAARNGEGVFIHHAMPRYSDKVVGKNGSPLDLWQALYKHEMAERYGMVEEGLPYLVAHRKLGVPAERAYVEGEGADWAKYTEVVAGELGKIEKTPVRNPPPDPHVDPNEAVRAGTARDHAALPLIEIGGMPVLLEVRAGEPRWPGKPWPADYGYIRRTSSAEGEDEAVDCFLGPQRDAPTAFVINHYDRTGKFEEHKIFFAYPSAQAAIRDYKTAYSHHSASRLEWCEYSLPQLRDWLERGDMGRALMRAAS